MEDADGRGKGSSWKPLKILVKTKTRERERERSLRTAFVLAIIDFRSLLDLGKLKGAEGKRGRKASAMDVRSKER